MTHSKIFTIILLLVQLNVFGQNARTNNIGERTFHFKDEKRNRPLVTEVWYPTSDTLKTTDKRFSPFIRDYTVRDGSLPAGHFPLIMVSHGTGGNRLSLEWLAQSLVKAGYIVAAVDHWGNTSDNKIAVEFIKAWERPQDPPIPFPKLIPKLPFLNAIFMVGTSGSALALASIGFGCIASFITLYFIQNHWQNASFALAAFGFCYVIVRLLFSNYPDKFGGVRVAFVSLMIEIIGLGVIWTGINGILTIAGAALTGAGMSLIFPSLGQLAVKKVNPDNRGTAIAAYNAFFDLGMGLTAPLAGVIAGPSHYQNVYLFAILTTVTSALLVYKEFRKAQINNIL